MALKMHASLAVHAGEWLRTEIVEPHGIKIGDLARHFGVSRQSISAICRHGHSFRAGIRGEG